MKFLLMDSRTALHRLLTPVFCRKFIFPIIFLCFFSTISNGQAFVITWQADNYKSLRIAGQGTNYTISWVDMEDSSYHGTFTATNAAQISVSRISTYRISISGGSPEFNRISFPTTRDKISILSIEQWGSIIWSSMEYAFEGCSNLVVNAADAPNLSNVTSLRGMFSGCSLLNSDISSWNTGNVTDMTLLFKDAASFNQPIGSWNTSNVTNMGEMFEGATAFNQPIGNWNTSNVSNMGLMFAWAYAFDQPIGNWNTGNVVYMNQMFNAANSFNQPIDNWNTSKVINMAAMFDMTIFNQPVGSWNVSNVIYLSMMFSNNRSFNQPLNNWNIAHATAMDGMFQYASSFNQDIGNWNTANVSNMDAMFKGATNFNQNLGHWNINAVTSMIEMLGRSGLSVKNYDSTLTGWSGQAVQNNVSLGAYGLKYCNSQTQRNDLMISHGWNITNDSMDCTSYATILKVCPEQNVNFTPAISGTNYQWQTDTGSGFTNIYDNSIYSGTQTNNLQINAILSSFYGHRYRCIVDGINSNSFNLEIANEWAGTVNSSWENPLNWTCGIVPDENTDVLIGSGTIIVSSSTTIRSLHFEAGADLTIIAPAALTITH